MAAVDATRITTWGEATPTTLSPNSTPTIATRAMRSSVRSTSRKVILLSIVGTDLTRTMFKEKSDAAASVSYNVDTNWYVDTGTTVHVTGELDKLMVWDWYNGNDQIPTTSGV